MVEAHRDTITKIGYITSKALPIPDTLSALPKLKRLYIDAPLDTLPERILAQPALTELELINLKLEVLPKLDCPKIETINLENLVSMDQLPEVLGDLAELETLKLDNCAVRALPDSLGRCSKLHYLEVYDMPYIAVPQSLFNHPRLAGKEKLRELHAACGPYQAAYQRLEFLIEWTSKIPEIKAAKETWLATKDPEAAKLRELLLALTRSYYDDEHGPSSNLFYISELMGSGESELIAASEAIEKIKHLHKTTLSGVVKGAFKKLREVEGFDVEAFANFVYLLSGNPAAKLD